MNPTIRPDIRISAFSFQLSQRAFTLIELLTVIAIIGILAGLVIGGIAGVRKKANQVRCLSNLRQVGVAIIAYANDNKDQLPGPTLLNASSTYTKNGKNTFGHHLARYLDLRRPEDLGTTTGTVPYLRCPQRINANPDDTSAPFFIVQCRLPQTSNGSGRPFGAAPVNPGDETKSPIRYNELDNFGGPSRVWALIEADQGLGAWGTVKGSGWFNNLPATPVHGGSRATLFFDARVQLFKDLPPDPK